MIDSDIKFHVFTGTHSTGKTTVLDELKLIYPEYSFHNSITRYAKDLGINLNTDIDDAGQSKMLDLYEKYELEYIVSDSIMDRCLIDTAAYTRYFYKIGKVSIHTLNRVEKALELRLSKYTNVFYFPIEFNNVIDSCRVDDEVYRRSVDRYIKHYLRYYNISYTTIRGSVTTRVNTITNGINIITNKEIS